MKTPSSDTGGSQPLNFPIQINPSSSEWKTAIFTGWHLHICIFISPYIDFLAVFRNPYRFLFLPMCLDNFDILDNIGNCPYLF